MSCSAAQKASNKMEYNEHVNEQRWSYILGLGKNFDKLKEDKVFYVNSELEYRTPKNFKFLKNDFRIFNENYLKTCESCRVNNSEDLLIPQKYNGYFKFTRSNEMELLFEKHCIVYYSPIYKLVYPHEGFEYFVQELRVVQNIDAKMAEKKFETVGINYFLKANNEGMFIDGFQRDTWIDIINLE